MSRCRITKRVAWRWNFALENIPLLHFERCNPIFFSLWAQCDLVCSFQALCTSSLNPGREVQFFLTWSLEVAYCPRAKESNGWKARKRWHGAHERWIECLIRRCKRKSQACTWSGFPTHHSMWSVYFANGSPSTRYFEVCHGSNYYASIHISLILVIGAVESVENTQGEPHHPACFFINKLGKGGVFARGCGRPIHRSDVEVNVGVPNVDHGQEGLCGGGDPWDIHHEFISHQEDPPSSAIAGICAKLQSLFPPRQGAVNCSTLSSYVSWRQTTWHEEAAMVSLTVVKRTVIAKFFLEDKQHDTRKRRSSSLVSLAGD